MKYLVMLLACVSLSGCGFSAMQEQIRKSQNMNHYQECKKTTVETPIEGGGKKVEENTLCRQWKK